MLFNEMDTLSYSEIKEASRIEDKELKRTLQSLSVRATAAPSATSVGCGTGPHGACGRSRRFTADLE